MPLSRIVAKGSQSESDPNEMSRKGLTKYDENASQQVSSMLISLTSIMLTSVSNKQVLTFLPADELHNQNEWFDSISNHNDGFMQDLWLNEISDMRRNAKVMESSSMQGYANPDH